MSRVRDAGLPTDDALIRRALAGDQRAFELLVARHRAKVLRVATRVLRSPSDAEDVAQETLLGCYRGLASFSGRAAFSTWLCQLAVNAALMSRRAARSRSRSRLESAGTFAASDDTDELPANDGLPRPEELLDCARLLRLVERALIPLDECSRAVFAMRAVEGASTREVASVLNISPLAVRQRLHRARASIRRQLAPLLESA